MENFITPIYLIVADESDEFSAALRYASRAAHSNGAHIGVLYVMDGSEFTHWGNVEERMKQEQREAAEAFVEKVTAKISALCGLNTVVFIEEGDRPKALIRVLEENPAITKLVLGASTQTSGPGPLVSYFSGKGITQLPVPLMVVPGHMSDQRIDELLGADRT